MLLSKVSLADDNFAKNFLNILRQPKKYSATIKKCRLKERHNAASNVLPSQEEKRVVFFPNFFPINSS